METEDLKNDNESDSDIEWMIELIQRGDENVSEFGGDNDDDDDSDHKESEQALSDEEIPRKKVKRMPVKNTKDAANEIENSRFLVVDVVRVPNEKPLPSKQVSKIPFLIQTQPKGFKWLYLPPQVKMNLHTAKSGLSLQDKVKMPFEYFKSLFTDYFLEMIVEGTNSYALQAETGKTYRASKWKRLEVKELRQFIALLLGMGIVQMESLGDYWLIQSIFSVPGLSSLMTQNRFLGILKYLCFTQLKKLSDYKASVVAVLAYLENRMQSIYTPARDIQLWKPIVLGGRKHRNSGILEKHRDELQLCLLAECGHDRGVFLRAQLNVEGLEEEDYSKRDVVVKNLVAPYAEKWRRLFVDEYYTSVSLAVELFSHKIYCTGVIKADHPENPEVLRKVSLKNGQCSQIYLDNGLCLAKWKCKSDKYMLSGDISGRFIKVSSEVVAPEMFAESSALTRNDLDERLKFVRHPCIRDLDPHKHLFILVFEIMLNNACEFYNMRCASSSRMNLTQFRKTIVLELSGAARK